MPHTRSAHLPGSLLLPHTLCKVEAMLANDEPRQSMSMAPYSSCGEPASVVGERSVGGHRNTSNCTRAHACTVRTA